MKYCSHCGAQIMDDAIVCVHCGCGITPNTTASKKDDTLETIVKVMLILGCVAEGWLIIPLAWCIPITVTIFRRFKAGEPISTGLKVCSLLFVNLIAGICLLCMDD